MSPSIQKVLTSRELEHKTMLTKKSVFGKDLLDIFNQKWFFTIIKHSLVF